MRANLLRSLKMDNLIINPEDLLKLPANSSLATHVLNLLSTCTLEDVVVREIEDLVLDGEIRMDELDQLIIDLKDAQVDKIDAGKPYSMKDIHNKLRRMNGEML